MKNFCTRNGGSEISGTDRREKKIAIISIFVLPNYPVIFLIFLKINCTGEMKSLCFQCCYRDRLELDKTDGTCSKHGDIRIEYRSC